ncbi:DNA cytosine methyltransferase [Paenibacillus sp. RC84]|uniref:DNA cytosine methyltransferase n=1 Tax=Paenibacillus sp. RC84 TaxID=3156252 RepID=UPI0035198DDC
MKALSLFSGIGGIDLACEWAGIETVAFCEREPFPQKVLRKHWPEVPIYDDVCTLTKERLEADGIGTIDLIHGGYPCQPFSYSGKRKGKVDDRYLWPEYFRLVKELKPRWVVGENVAGHVTLGLDEALSDLEGAGYTNRAFIIPACAVDAPHRRDRVFIVAHSAGERFAETGKHQPSRPKEWLAGGCENVSYSYSQLSPKPRFAWEWREQPCNRGLFTGNWINPYNWKPEPSVGRVAHGIADWVDRLKGLGNAVVPQQIYPIFAAIMQIEAMNAG